MSNQAAVNEPKYPHKNAQAPAPPSLAMVPPEPPAPTAEPLPIDLRSLSVGMVARVIAEAQADLERRKAEAREKFEAFVKENAPLLGVTPERLLAAVAGKAPAARPQGAVDRRSVVVPKYRDPADASRTWSGRGNPPKWYSDALASGRSEEELRIPSPNGAP